VHRVLKLHEKEDGTVKFLTKGDNNSVDDRGLYAPGQVNETSLTFYIMNYELLTGVIIPVKCAILHY